MDLTKSVKDEDVAISKLQFILRVARSDPSQAELVGNTRALLSTLRVSRVEKWPLIEQVRNFRLCIPDLEIDRYKECLNLAIKSYQDIQGRIDSLGDKNELLSKLLDSDKKSINLAAQTMAVEKLQPEVTSNDVIAELNAAEKWRKVLQVTTYHWSQANLLR